MNYVQPIRDLKKLEEFKRFVQRKSFRNFAMVNVGLNSGLRISDILVLKVSSVKDRDYVVITEKKTGKIRRIYFSPAIRDFLQDYIQDMADGDYLFPSQVGENKPLTRGQAYNIIAEAAEAVGLQNIGTHSLRKSFGYHHYQKFKDVAILQEIFNHSAPSVTLSYIGINDDVIKGTMQDFVL